MAGIIYPTTPGVSPTGASYNDGTCVYGAALVTYQGTNTYDCTDFSVEYPTTKKVQKNRYGVPVRQFALPEVPNGNFNMILASTSAVLPPPGASVTADVTGSVAWFIDKIGTPFKQEDFLVIPVSVSQKLN